MVGPPGFEPGITRSRTAYHSQARLRSQTQFVELLHLINDVLSLYYDIFHIHVEDSLSDVGAIFCCA